jgi:hypothetical protein
MGAQGATGPQGPAGPAGATAPRESTGSQAGSDAKVTCKIAKRKGKTVKTSCSVAFTASQQPGTATVTLSRGGRTYARTRSRVKTGPVTLRLRPAGWLRAGAYKVSIAIPGIAAPVTRTVRVGA